MTTKLISDMMLDKEKVVFKFSCRSCSGLICFNHNFHENGTRVMEIILP